MVRPGRRVLAVLLLLGLGPGCATAYRQGRQEAEQGNWDVAVARYTKALQDDPNNIKIKLHLENARVEASRFHFAEAKKHLAANDLDAAVDSLEIAVKYDPANRSAADDLLIARDRIRKRDEERQHRAEFEAMKERAQTVRAPVAVLSPRSPVPVVIKYTEASLEKILESLGKLAGVNILFDEGYRDKKYTVNLTGVTFQEALDQITFVNRLFYKVLDQNTLIIVPEGRQKRVAYDDLVLRTFYLQNAEVNDTLTLIKTIAKIQTAAGNPSLGAITVVGTLDQIAWAERIIESNDKARGEVMIEVEILNVNRTKLKQYGLRLSNYGAGIAFLPSGNASESAGGLTSVRAHLLSSFNLADFVVSVPTSLFAKFVQNDSNSRILASPRLRAAEGKKATLKIGQEVPIPVTTFSTVNTGVSSFAPATSFQYRNVGVNLDITPKVSASGDITLELVADFSLLGENRSVGNSGDLPTFFTRTVSGTLRLRDGETSLIGGLLQQAETDSFTGVFGLQSIPLLNKIFTDRDKKSDESEILISITPHIVRGPKLIERDMIPMGVGTSEVPKVEGARPSLFGPEPVPTPIPMPAAPKTPPGAGATRTPPAGSPARPPLPAVLPPVAPPEAAAPVSPLVPAIPSPLPGEAPEEPTPNALAAVSGAGSPAPAPANGGDARAATLLFSPPEASVKVGDKGGLGLVVVGARDVLGVEVVLTYDATLVELAEVGPGSLLTLDGQSVSAERTLEPGRARVRFSRTAPATGSGAIVSVTLKGLRAGSGGLGIESVALLRAGETERPSPPAPGRVIVSP